MRKNVLEYVQLSKKVNIHDLLDVLNNSMKFKLNWMRT